MIEDRIGQPEDSWIDDSEDAVRARVADAKAFANAFVKEQDRLLGNRQILPDNGLPPLAADAMPGQHTLTEGEAKSIDDSSGGLQEVKQEVNGGFRSDPSKARKPDASHPWVHRGIHAKSSNTNIRPQDEAGTDADVVQVDGSVHQTQGEIIMQKYFQSLLDRGLSDDEAHAEASRYSEFMTNLEKKIEDIALGRNTEQTADEVHPYTVGELLEDAEIDDTFNLRKRIALKRYADSHGIPYEGSTYMLTEQQRSAVLNQLNPLRASSTSRKKK